MIGGQPTLESQQVLVAKINAAFKVGDKVNVKQDDGTIAEWTMRHGATMVSCSAVIWTNEHSAAYLAERVIFK